MMSEDVIDLTGDSDVADLQTKMEIDNQSPEPEYITNAAIISPPTAPLEPAAPRSVEEIIIPIVLPPQQQQQQPFHQEQHPHVRQSRREKRPARQKAHFDDIVEMPQQLKTHRRAHGKVSLQAMQDHLNQLALGLQRQDPTVDLPDELPPPLLPVGNNMQVINLSEWSQERLNAEAAATSKSDPFAALLQDPPRAPRDRLGQFTGHKGVERKPDERKKSEHNADIGHNRGFKGVNGPQRPPSSQTDGTGGGGDGSSRPSSGLSFYDPSVSGETMIAVLDEQLSTGRDIPWTSIGRTGAPRIAGVEVGVGPLWESVCAHGGMVQATRKKRWNAIARTMGIDTENKARQAGFVLKRLYTNHMFAYEVYLKEGLEASEAVAKARGSESDWLNQATPEAPQDGGTSAENV